MGRQKAWFVVKQAYLRKLLLLDLSHVKPHQPLLDTLTELTTVVWYSFQF